MSSEGGAERTPSPIRGAEGPGSKDVQVPASLPRSRRLLSGPARFAHALWHDRGLVGACLAVSLGLSTAYNYTVRPRYEAAATIEIAKAPAAPAAGPGISNMTMTADTLFSDATLTDVLSRYRFDSSQDLAAGPLRTPLQSIGSRFFGGAAISSERDRGSGVVLAFRSRISVRPIPGTSLVDVAFEGYDPEFSIVAANGLARTLVEESMPRISDEAVEATRWLTNRISAEARKPGDAARSVDFAARQAAAETRLRTATGQLAVARSQARAEKEHLDHLRRMTPEDLMQLPELSSNASFQSARRDLTDLEARMADLGQSLGPKHPDMQRTQARIGELRAILAGTIADLLRRVEAAHKTAEREAAASDAGVKDAEAAVAALRNEAASAHAVPQKPQPPVEVAAEEPRIPDLIVRLARPASASILVFPDRGGNLAISLLLGLLAGTSFVGARLMSGAPDSARR